MDISRCETFDTLIVDDVSPLRWWRDAYDNRSSTRFVGINLVSEMMTVDTMSTDGGEGA